MSHGYVQDKDALIKRLHRIEGQVRGLERMVEDERYCIDILTQIGAAMTAVLHKDDGGRLRELMDDFKTLFPTVLTNATTKRRKVTK